MRDWLAVLVGLGLLLGSTAALAQEIPIGCYIPMTGAAAAMGQVTWQGIEIAHRLQPQVLGRPVKLVLVDTKSDKIEAANAVSRLIERDKVVAIIGEVISGNTLAGTPIAERFGIPNITPTATNPLVTQNRQYAFRACFVDSLQGKVAARFAREHLKAQKAALIIDQAQDYCVGLAKYFQEEFQRQGGQIVATTFIQTGDQDFSAQISAIKPAAPDIIYAPNYYAEDALLARQMQELGLKTPILTGDGAQVTDLVKIGGAAVEGMYFTAHFHREAVSTPLAQEFIKAYEATTKREVDAFAALGADCYFLLLQAIGQTQGTAGAQLRQALATTKAFPGVSGTITMGPDNNPTKEVMVLQVKNGKFVLVTKMAP